MDELGFLDAAIEYTAKESNITNPTVVRYKKTGFPALDSFFGVWSWPSTNPLEMTDLIYKQNTPQLLYLFTW